METQWGQITVDPVQLVSTGVWQMATAWHALPCYGNILSNICLCREQVRKGGGLWVMSASTLSCLPALPTFSLCLSSYRAAWDIKRRGGKQSSLSLTLGGDLCRRSWRLEEVVMLAATAAAVVGMGVKSSVSLLALECSGINKWNRFWLGPPDRASLKCAELPPDWNFNAHKLLGRRQGEAGPSLSPSLRNS